MSIICTVCGTSFTWTKEQLKEHEKFGEDPLAMCITCQHQGRMCYRNGVNLYRRTCDFTGEQIISIYAKDKPYKVYKSEIWWSDQWDAMSYGQEMDFSRPFFEQFRELQLKVPRLALTSINCENSPYCGMCEGNKNCHMIFGGDFNEDSMYGIFPMRNKSVVDADRSNHNERCYFMGDSFNCYGCQFTFDSKTCRDCAFISDCTGCNDCILCTNLSQQSFCIENKKLSKEEYLKRKAEILNGTWSAQGKAWKKFLKVRDERIVKYAHMLNCEDCVGDYMTNSKNCVDCYEAWDSQDCRDIVLAFECKDVFNSCCTGGNATELCYDTQSIISAYNCKHSFCAFDSQDIEYCDFVMNSHDLLGCTGVNKKSFCILNKQYSEKEYRELRKKITEHMKKTGEWGKFLPPECSCFGYNESTAQEYFPLKREEALKQGYQWYDTPPEPPEAEKIIPASKLPDAIDDIPDDVCNWAIQSSGNGELFNITKQELRFYRDMRLPVPRLSFMERYKQRMALRNPLKLWERKCAKCGTAIETTYAPERPETVYCEKCYLETVY